MSPEARSWAQTHPGMVRSHNEDSYLCRPDLGVWAVADGAGGHQSGEVASGMIASALGGLRADMTAGETLAEIRLAISATHSALQVCAEARGGDAIIASTVVILVLRDGHFACLWAGDSRAYLLRDGELIQISHDHSLVQEMVDAGGLAAADAERHPRANIITRAVGAGPDRLELDKVIGETRPGDRFLLCSDGLSKTLPEAELTSLLAAPDGVAAAELLIAAALARRVNDNVTAVVVEAPG